MPLTQIHDVFQDFIFQKKLLVLSHNICVSRRIEATVRCLLQNFVKRYKIKFLLRSTKINHSVLQVKINKIWICTH